MTYHTLLLYAGPLNINASSSAAWSFKSRINDTPYNRDGSYLACAHNDIISHAVWSNFSEEPLSSKKLLFLYQMLGEGLVPCQKLVWIKVLMIAYKQNPTSSGWLQSLLLLRRFCTFKKCDEIKYVYSIPSSNNT